MIDIKNEIASKIAKVTKLNEEELKSYIEIPMDNKNGDYAFPCFKLAKELRQAPPVIANNIKEKIEIDNNIIKDIQVIGGYLNFYINKNYLTKEVLGEISSKDQYGKSEAKLLRKYIEENNRKLLEKQSLDKSEITGIKK